VRCSQLRSSSFFTLLPLECHIERCCWRSVSAHSIAAAVLPAMPHSMRRDMAPHCEQRCRRATELQYDTELHPEHIKGVEARPQRGPVGAGECAVLYCWELQVEAAAKRKGLGRFLMQLLELLARRCAAPSNLLPGESLLVLANGCFPSALFSPPVRAAPPRSTCRSWKPLLYGCSCASPALFSLLVQRCAAQSILSCRTELVSCKQAWRPNAAAGRISKSLTIHQRERQRMLQCLTHLLQRFTRAPDKTLYPKPYILPHTRGGHGVSRADIYLTANAAGMLDTGPFSVCIAQRRHGGMLVRCF